MAALLGTPDRVLKRVQQLEDMELPSLPSFHPDFDDDTDRSITYDKTYGTVDSHRSVDSIHPNTADDLSTPHVGRTHVTPRLRPPSLPASPDGGFSTVLSAPSSRIPSLSQSDVSVTDIEATTPEGPGARVLDKSIAFSDYGHPTADYAQSTEYGQATTTYDHPTEGATYDNQTDDTVMGRGADDDHTTQSPLKSTPMSSKTITPGPMRYMDVPSTAARAAATPLGNGGVNALRDVTPVFRNRVPLTPSHAYSPSTDYGKTPRATLDDAERRKRDALSFLASSSLPSRFQKRGTPHPLRRASFAPETDSVTEEGASTAGSILDDAGSANESFISIASSQDLTIDRRGSRAFHKRGNTSVPDMLLGTSSPGAILGLDSRPDANKIHKHFNNLNKQLMESNEQIARESDAWRDECARLVGLLREVGVELDDDGQVVGDLPRTQRKDDSLELPTVDDSMSFGRPSSRTSHAEKDKIISDLREQLQSANEVIEKVNIALEDSEKAHAATKINFGEQTQEHARQFGEICAELQEQVKTLESNLEAKEDEVAQLRSQNSSESPPRGHQVGSNELNDQIDTLNDELGHVREDLRVTTDKMKATESRLAEAQRALHDCQERLDESDRHSSDLEKRLQEADNVADEAARKIRTLENLVNTTESAKDSAQDEVEALAVRVPELELKIVAKDDEIQRQQQAITELEDAAKHERELKEHLDRRLHDIEDELEDVRAMLGEKEAAVASLQTKLEIIELEKETPNDRSYRSVGSNSVVVALEDKLDDAYRELGQLRTEIQNWQTANENCEIRIKVLETEKAALQERLAVHQLSSPPKAWNNSTRAGTPLAHKAITSLRTPLTPGPLKDLSWLHSTVGDLNESHWRARIDQLQGEIDVANSNLDRNFVRLEEAGLGAVDLAKKLAMAKDRIAELEEELNRLARENKKSLASLNVDRTKNERLENALDAVHEQLSSLKTNMREERERLSDDNRRLRVQLADLQTNADDEVESLGLELVRIQRDTEDKLAENEQRLKEMQDDKDKVESKLRASRTTIERLESEIKRLQKSAGSASAQNGRLRDQSEALSRQQETIEALENTLRDAQKTSEALRQTLRQRANDLDEANRELDQLKAERARVTKELVAFGDDLGVQRRECGKFGAELDALRREQADGKAAHSKSLARLEDDLQWTRERLETATREAEEAQRMHAELDSQMDACMKSQSRSVQEQRQKVKYLAAQIKYLKAKYARENTFRNALVLQKKYLLTVVGGMSQTEQETLRELAKMGYPIRAPPHPRLSLKSVAMAVLATIRARNKAAKWAETKEAKEIGTARKSVARG